jgi:hypothetical protein
MKRTAVSCRESDAHLGHIFDDVGRRTGLRYCMNSAAMVLREACAAVAVVREGDREHIAFEYQIITGGAGVDPLKSMRGFADK